MTERDDVGIRCRSSSAEFSEIVEGQQCNRHVVRSVAHDRDVERLDIG